MWRTPAAAGAARASAGRSASQRGVPSGAARLTKRGSRPRLAGSGEGLQHVGTHLELPRPDAGPEPGLTAPGAQPAAWRTARCHRGLQHTPARPRQPAWAAPTARPSRRAEQHRQAVGHLHGAGHAGLGGPGGIGLGASAGRRRVAERSTACRAPAAATPAARPGRCAKAAPVVGHGRGVVAHRAAQVQAVERRRADAAARVLMARHTRRRASRGSSASPVQDASLGVRAVLGPRAVRRRRASCRRRTRASRGAHGRAGSRSAAR
jgi:hypothetical protein